MVFWGEKYDALAPYMTHKISPRRLIDIEGWSCEIQHLIVVQKPKGALGEMVEGTLEWQETLLQMGRGQLCRQCKNRVRVGWLVIALSWGDWSWHYQKVISYSCLYLALLKMNCEKQILLKVAAFVLFEARNWLIGRNNFTALMYSASC